MPRKEERKSLRIIDRANANQFRTKIAREFNRRFFAEHQQEYDSIEISNDIAAEKVFQYNRAQEHLVQGDLTIEEVNFLRRFTGSNIFIINDQQRDEARYGVRRQRTRTLDEVFDELNISQNE